MFPVVIIMGCLMCLVGCVYCCCISSFKNVLAQTNSKPPEPTSSFIQHPRKINVQSLKVLYNPNAGSRDVSKILEVCKGVWSQAGIKLDLTETQYPGHTRELLMTMSFDGFDGVVVVGGDGTIHEAVNGLLARADKKRIPLGFIPAGSGNSVMCDLGTWDFKTAAERIASGNAMGTDINVVYLGDDRIASINCICFSISNEISILSEKMRCLGAGRYMAMAIILSLKKFEKEISMRLVLKNQQIRIFREKLALCYINNTKYFGKKALANPYARLDDGKLHVMLARANEYTRGDYIKMLGDDGSLYNDPKDPRKELVAQDCSFKMKPGLICIDGELYRQGGTVHVRCFPRTIEVFADPNAIAGDVTEPTL